MSESALNQGPSLISHCLQKILVEISQLNILHVYCSTFGKFLVESVQSLAFIRSTKCWNKVAPYYGCSYCNFNVRSTQYKIFNGVQGILNPHKQATQTDNCKPGYLKHRPLFLNVFYLLPQTFYAVW